VGAHLHGGDLGTSLGRQGTLSVWSSLEAMKAFAYGTAAHREAMRRRAEEEWYSEELFARFRPIASEGTWDGADPLASLLTATAA
jgi:predicted phage tail protein